MQQDTEQQGTNQQDVNDITPFYGLISMLEDAGVLKAADDRKLNSFACACCRLIWDDLLPEARSALELAERYTQGFVSSEDLLAARIKLWEFCDSLPDTRTRLANGGRAGNDSAEVCGTRAVICCMYERDPDDFDIHYEYDLLIHTTSFCDKVQRIPMKEYHQLLLSVFGTPPYAVEEIQNTPDQDC